ncbi:MAG: efflux RND transporter periplasmic adaptor subunit [Crocinitomicaceae bacterium]|jgi:membrane fusion protein (multidrug efflux system)|nr:efflux RND transporter periplasmic adaptor subunit [Crocinitomicaceae bacterium]
MNKLFIGLGLLTLTTLLSCGGHKAEGETEQKLVVTKPLQKDTLVTKEYVSQIRAIQHIELRAQERGYLEKIFVDEGQFVHKGDVLFQIMPKLYEADLKKAEAELNFARIEYINTKRLADSNVVAQNELAMAKAKLDKAQAELDLRKVHLDFTTIRAPFDGIIDRFHVRLGSLIEEGDLLTYLSDNDKMWVYFNVPEAEYLAYKSTMPEDSLLKVQLKMANHEMFAYEGVVETIEADFDNETGNIAFRATFPNPKKLLRHGETGNIQIVSNLENALLIPQKATFEVLEKKYVFVVGKDNKVHQTEVKIAAEIPDIYVISAGVTAKDRILYEGIRNVRNGEKIEFNFEDPHVVFNKLRVYVE